MRLTLEKGVSFQVLSASVLGIDRNLSCQAAEHRCCVTWVDFDFDAKNEVTKNHQGFGFCSAVAFGSRYPLQVRMHYSFHISCLSVVF